MKVSLLHRDQDFAVRPELRDAMFDAMTSGDLFAITRIRYDRERKKEPAPPLAPTGNDAVLAQDLELQTLWNAMAAGDEFLFEMAKRAVLSPLTSPDAITYRQQVLADCLEHPEIVRELYQLAVDALENERAVGGLWSIAGPDRILSRSVRVLELQAGVLRRLRQIADQEEAASFRSEGFTRFFAMLTDPGAGMPAPEGFGAPGRGAACSKGIEAGTDFTFPKRPFRDQGPSAAVRA